MKLIHLGTMVFLFGITALASGGGVTPIKAAVDTVHVPCTDDPSANGETFRRVVQETQTGTIQLADDCTYRVGPQDGPSTDAVIIESKRDLTIRGHGAGRTRIELTRDVFLGFKVTGNVDGLTIEDMTIAGSITDPDPTNFCGGTFPLTDSPDQSCNGVCPNRAAGQTPNTHAIATGARVRNVTYRYLEVHDVAVGIKSGECDGTCTNVTIEKNHIHDIRGTCPGSGYGISNRCTQNLTIRDNTIRRTGRHAIYQAETLVPLASAKGDNVLIAGNLIVDHRRGPFHDGNGNWTKVALVIARSSYVTAISNVIVNSYEMPISVELNENTGAYAENVFLINNRILGPALNATGRDIWIQAGGRTPVVMWFNRRNETQAAQRLVDSGIEVTPARWEGTQWIESTAGDGQLYVMWADTLFRVTPEYHTNPDTWARVRSTTSWAGFQSMATAGDSYVYVMRGNLLHRVVPEPETKWWFHWYATRSWSGFRGMSAYDGHVFVMQDECLHRVTAENRIGDWDRSTACGWTPFSAVRAGANGHLWMYRGGSSVYELGTDMAVTESTR